MANFEELKAQRGNRLDVAVKAKGSSHHRCHTGRQYSNVRIEPNRLQAIVYFDPETQNIIWKRSGKKAVTRENANAARSVKLLNLWYSVPMVVFAMERGYYPFVIGYKDGNCQNAYIDNLFDLMPEASNDEFGNPHK